MKINQFISLYKNKIDELLDLDIIIPSKDEYDYYPGDWTFLFNCAVFDIVKDFNKTNSANLSICAEPEADKTPNGRGGYSDILICSNDKKERFITIEHENFPLKRIKNVVQKLSKSKANAKLLITYFSEDMPKDKLISEANINVNQYFGNDEKLHLLIAPFEIGAGNEYKLLEIKKWMS